MLNFNLETIVSILTISGILAKAGWWLFKFIKEQYTTIIRVHQQVDTIFKEITPNHGTSIKDKVNAMSKEITSNTQMTEQIFYRQRWMMDHRSEAIFEAENSGEISWVNKPYCKLTSRESADLLGHNWKNTIYEEDRERVVSNWDASVKDGRMFEDFYRIVIPDGRIINVTCSAAKVKGHGYLGSIQLATESCIHCPAHKPI
jgi:PAS domain S-box-containing protein